MIDEQELCKGIIASRSIEMARKGKYAVVKITQSVEGIKLMERAQR